MAAVAGRPGRTRRDSWLGRASSEKAAAPSLQDVAGAPRPPRSRSEARGEGQEPRRSQARGRGKVRTPSPIGLQCKLCRRPQEKWGCPRPETRGGSLRTRAPRSSPFGTEKDKMLHALSSLHYGYFFR